MYFSFWFSFTINTILYMNSQTIQFKLLIMFTLNKLTHKSSNLGQRIIIFFLRLSHRFLSHLAWNTRPNAPSPMSRTYSMLLRGYSSIRSLELSSRGRRWYMGFGCSLSRSSSDGRAVRVGASMALLRTHNRSQEQEKSCTPTSREEKNVRVSLFVYGDFL